MEKPCNTDQNQLQMWHQELHGTLYTDAEIPNPIISKCFTKPKPQMIATFPELLDTMQGHKLTDAGGTGGVQEVRGV